MYANNLFGLQYPEQHIPCLRLDLDEGELGKMKCPGRRIIPLENQYRCIISKTIVAISICHVSSHPLVFVDYEAVTRFNMYG
jgi:hypothetical protein